MGSLPYPTPVPLPPTMPPHPARWRRCRGTLRSALAPAIGESIIVISNSDEEAKDRRSPDQTLSPSRHPISSSMRGSTNSVVTIVIILLGGGSTYQSSHRIEQWEHEGDARGQRSQGWHPLQPRCQDQGWRWHRRPCQTLRRQVVNGNTVGGFVIGNYK